jgi:outer membrane protein assembly factor BamD
VAADRVRPELPGDGPGSAAFGVGKGRVEVAGKGVTGGDAAGLASGRASGVRRRWARAAALALALGSAAVLAACSGDKDDMVLVDTPADKLYNEGLAYVQAGNLRDAAKSFEKLDRAHPYSEYARKAMVMTAFVQYSRGDYSEAINSARRFVTLYPNNPDAAYALYIIGNSYYRQVPDVNRDQEMSGKAMAAMQELVDRFPDSEYADDARQKVLATRNQLAGKEMEIGRYYLQRRDYIAAINRFRVVVTQFQQTNHIEEALARLTECYYALGVVKEAQTAAAVLGHNFPDSSWYKASYELLQKGGYSPSEDKSSWISKAFSGFKLF